MKINLSQELARFMKIMRSMSQFKNVQFAMLYGSYAQRKATPLSDIDIAIYYQGNAQERFKFRLALLGKLPECYDVHVYQDLPLYVQQRVLGGKLLYTKDRRFVYTIAHDTIQRFEDFKKYYYDYIGARKLLI